MLKKEMFEYAMKEAQRKCFEFAAIDDKFLNKKGQIAKSGYEATYKILKSANDCSVFMAFKVWLKCGVSDEYEMFVPVFVANELREYFNDNVYMDYLKERMGFHV